MHTVSISHVRSAVDDYFSNRDEIQNWPEIREPETRHPHLMEHEQRAAELAENDDEDAALIHRLLGQNMLRARQETF